MFVSRHSTTQMTKLPNLKAYRTPLSVSEVHIGDLLEQNCHHFEEKYDTHPKQNRKMITQTQQELAPLFSLLVLDKIKLFKFVAECRSLDELKFTTTQPDSLHS